jgi:hypothetical protein
MPQNNNLNLKIARVHIEDKIDHGINNAHSHWWQTCTMQHLSIFHLHEYSILVAHAFPYPIPIDICNVLDGINIRK